MVFAKIKQLDEEKLALEKEINTLEEELTAVTQKRDKIFENITELRKKRDEGVCSSIYYHENLDNSGLLYCNRLLCQLNVLIYIP